MTSPKPDDNKCRIGYGEIGTLCMAGGNVNGTDTEEHGMGFLKKLKCRVAV
jgi:hypothetical protein